MHQEVGESRCPSAVWPAKWVQSRRATDTRAQLVWQRMCRKPLSAWVSPREGLPSASEPRKKPWVREGAENTGCYKLRHMHTPNTTTQTETPTTTHVHARTHIHTRTHTENVQQLIDRDVPSEQCQHHIVSHLLKSPHTSTKEMYVIHNIINNPYAVNLKVTFTHYTMSSHTIHLSISFLQKANSFVFLPKSLLWQESFHRFPRPWLEVIRSDRLWSECVPGRGVHGLYWCNGP